MKEYKMYRTDYMTDLVFKTNNLEEMKDFVIKILRENYKICMYALSGISEYKKNDFEGAWIEVWENGKKINSVDYYDIDKIKD